MHYEILTVPIRKFFSFLYVNLSQLVLQLLCCIVMATCFNKSKQTGPSCVGGNCLVRMTQVVESGILLDAHNARARVLVLHNLQLYSALDRPIVVEALKSYSRNEKRQANEYCFSRLRNIDDAW